MLAARTLNRRAAGFGLGATLLFLSACVPPYPEVDAETTMGISGATFTMADEQVYYVTAGTAGKPRLIFIHGTPGSWQAFRRYLRDPVLQSRFEMIAVDRPGFGKSDAIGLQPSLAAQTRYIEPLLAAEMPTVLVGHSLGGTIAYRAAVDFPGRVDGIVVISSSVDPALGAPRWYNRLADFPLLKWAVPGALRRANDEIMPLRRQLEDLQPSLADVDMPVTVIHGEADRLVSPDNVTFARQHLTGAELTVIREPGHGHFLIWEKPDVITGAILQMARNL